MVVVGGGIPVELGVMSQRGDGGGERLCDVGGGLSGGEGPVVLLLVLLVLSRVV